MIGTNLSYVFMCYNVQCNYFELITKLKLQSTLKILSTLETEINYLRKIVKKIRNKIRLEIVHYITCYFIKSSIPLHDSKLLL